MKKFKALGMVSVFAILISFSCKKGGVEPNPTSNGPQITFFSTSPSSINYNGQQVSGIVNLNWTSTNAVSAKLNGAEVSTSGNLAGKDPVFATTEYKLLVTDANGVSKEEVKTVTVNINAILAKITGPTGKSWKLTSFKARLSGSGSPFQETITECEKKRIHTFYPNGKWYLDFGPDLNCGPGTVWDSFFTFYPDSMEFLDSGSPIKRKVTFPSSNTMMFEYSEGNGDYQQIYTSV